MFKRHADLEQVWKFNKVTQRSISNSPICWCEEHPHKVTALYKQYLRSYRVHKAAWPWASLKVQKCHTKINIELIRDFDVENTTIMLQLDTGNLWRVITFTRPLRMNDYKNIIRGPTCFKGMLPSMIDLHALHQNLEDLVSLWIITVGLVTGTI